MGLEDQFLQPTLSGCCRLIEPIFAGRGGEEENAPIPAIAPASIEQVKSTRSGHSLGSTETTAHAPQPTFAPRALDGSVGWRAATPGTQPLSANLPSAPIQCNKTQVASAMQGAPAQGRGHAILP